MWGEKLPRKSYMLAHWDEEWCVESSQLVTENHSIACAQFKKRFSHDLYGPNDLNLIEPLNLRKPELVE